MGINNLFSILRLMNTHFVVADLLASADSFAEPGVSSFLVMHFDLPRNQLLVGAR